MITSLEDLKQTLSEPEWQSMDSAPKDCDILLYTKFRGVVRGHFDYDRYVNKPKPYWTYDMGRLWRKAACRADQPTHWMPLPQPPKE